MFSTSPVDEVDQRSPVTTDGVTDAPDLVGELHAFVTERVLERVAHAGTQNDWARVDEYLRELRTLDVMYAATKRDPDQASATLARLRSIAVRDREHAQFRAEWCGTARRGLAHAGSARSSG